MQIRPIRPGDDDEWLRLRKALWAECAINTLKEEMADILVRLGQLGTAHPCIEEIDINPIVVKEGAPLAVDANIIVKAEGR